MYIAILGRQPAISVAELERLYGADSVAWLSDESAKVSNENFDFERLGGSRKAGRIITEFPGLKWPFLSEKIATHYQETWQNLDHKITLGISCYGFDVKPRDILKLGLSLKKIATKSGGSLRLIPNADPALSTATSHHNKLGLSPNKIELLLVKASNGRIILAESVGTQNITALAARDQARPKTDAFVGMLPPKLARMMVNMATGASSSSLQPSHSEGSAFPAEVGTRRIATSGPTVPEQGDGHDELRGTVLDPFCGTGVVLQEASLLGYKAYGTDLSEKMVDYSRANLEWLKQRYRYISVPRLELGDATKHAWQPPINAIASESYLGQPFSAPPAPEKLAAVRDNCDHIISAFLKNIASQLKPGTPLCLAIPAWRDTLGNFTHLPLIDNLSKLGYQRIELEHARADQLLYYRENQVVARELLILSRV